MLSPRANYYEQPQWVRDAWDRAQDALLTERTRQNLRRAALSDLRYSVTMINNAIVLRDWRMVAEMVELVAKARAALEEVQA